MDRAPRARWNWTVDTVQDTGGEVVGSSPVVASDPSSYAIAMHTEIEADSRLWGSPRQLRQKCQINRRHCC